MQHTTELRGQAAAIGFTVEQTVWGTIVTMPGGQRLSFDLEEEAWALVERALARRAAAH